MKRHPERVAARPKDRASDKNYWPQHNTSSRTSVKTAPGPRRHAGLMSISECLDRLANSLPAAARLRVVTALEEARNNPSEGAERRVIDAYDRLVAAEARRGYA